MAPFFHVAQSKLTLNEPLVPSFGKAPHQQKKYDYLRENWNHEHRNMMLKLSLIEDPTMSMNIKEFVFELVRSEEFSHRPSRFDSVFVFRSPYDGMTFKEATQGKGLYVCRIDDGRLTNLDMGFCDPADRGISIEDQLADLTERSRRYWSGYISEEPCIETLVSGGIVMPIDELLKGE